MVELEELVVQTNSLSTNLNELRQQCGHESTSADISNAVEELQSLGKELGDLNTAVEANQELYTDAFHEDLAEIKVHLEGIFEDISDCCKEMQKADSLHTSAVGWLTKKRYVKKLQKHLEANRTTLIVMRMVLHHGKEYGLQQSPGRLAESSPHTMQENLAILETVFASRNAIHDLHNLGSHEHSSSTSSAGTIDTALSFKPGAHGHNLSFSTGVDVPAVEGFLPVSEKKKMQDALTRRFSRRGVRLAVHSSIIGTKAHEVPISLRKRWMREAHLRGEAERFNADSPSFAQLSRISEACFISGPDETPPSFTLQQASKTSDDWNKRPSPERTDSQASSGSGRGSQARNRSSSLVNSPLGKRLGRIIKRLSRNGLRERHENARVSPEAIGNNISPAAGTVDEADPEKIEQDGATKKQMSAKEKPGWSYRLTRPFVKEEPTTPDFDKGF